MTIRVPNRALATRLGLVALLPLALAACADAASGGASSSGPTSPPAAATSSTQGCPPADGSAPRRTSFPAAPPMCIDAARSYTAQFATDAGNFVVQLDAGHAPKTVNNFVVLARYHFYDGVVFHRVIPGFMIQGGDPEGTGRGGPGYRIEDELPQAGAYKVGSLAMANTGAPNSGGSQFFIVTGPQGVSLSPDYALFGQVTSGMDVVSKIEADGSAGGAPTTKHTIKAVTVTER